jgi:hypothetical protein
MHGPRSLLAVLRAAGAGAAAGAARERARLAGRPLDELPAAPGPLPSGRPGARRRRGPRRILLSLILLGVTGVIAGVGSYSAFSAKTSNTGDAFTAGSVSITDNHTATALISLTNAKPGDSDSGCIQVSYSGSLAAVVHLYGAGTGALAPYLTLTVTRGTDSSPTNYNGQGAGVVYSGNLSDFATTYAAGIVDPTVGGGTESWTNPESHSYKFTITAQDNNSSQGLSGSASFTWEAHNS